MDSAQSSSYDSAGLGYDSGGGISVNTGYSAQEAFGSGSSASAGGYASSSGGGGAQKTSFFSSSSQSKYEDLKQMLESSKEVPKLEAMKRIITMVAKGRSADSARELFPHVVKNVVTKNSELKKLVYLYLTRYAEQEQDLALLSIATFQHALKDPNPLIRGSAIRVLSSIRVPMITPIMLIAIKDCANDMSPYVRKTAAHAIPKLFSLDPDIKEEVVEIITKLLQDKVSLVLGSAVAAFEEVCPERIDLIHENYRKLCQLLVDVDEWGQILIINMLLRYARTQFINPNLPGAPKNIDGDHILLIRSAKPLLQSRNSGVVLSVIQLYLSIGPQLELTAQLVRPLIRLLHSHREIQLIILKNIVTLTSSEFNDKFMGVTQAAGGGNNAQEETKKVNGSSKPKVAKSNSESESDSDSDTPTTPPTTTNRSIKTLFDTHLKSFFVKSKDSTQTKILKLEILTNLATSGNISLILREFQAYILNYQDDLEFMSATIESIGQCASAIKEIAPICLNGLVSLLSNRNESIVAQSIVVIRSQIINKDDTIISMIIRQIVKLMEKISTPQARATIVWIVAEFCSRNEYARKVASDVLRKIAKSFCLENDLVKLQALNLAAKLNLTILAVSEGDSGEEDVLPIPEKLNLDRLRMLVNYIFNLAKYDLNYDVRDRGRFLKQILGDLSLAKKVLLVPKAVPNVSQRCTAAVYVSGSNGQDSVVTQVLSPANILAPSTDSARYRIGTLSHFLGKKASEYEELPDWPEVAPDPGVRKSVIPETKGSAPGASALAGLQAKAKAFAGAKDAKKKAVIPQKNGFLSSEEEDEESDEEDDEEEDEEVDEEDEEEEDDEEDDEELEDEEDEEESDDDEEESDEEESESEEEEEEAPPPQPVKKAMTKTRGPTVQAPVSKSSKGAPKKPTNKGPDVDMLLDFGDQGITSDAQIDVQFLLPLTASSSSTVTPTHTVLPFKTVECAEQLSFKEFSLIEVPYNYRASYRFPRINEKERTLVELMLKNELPQEEGRSEEERRNKISVQLPEGGVVVCKNAEVSEDGRTLSLTLAPSETRLLTLSIDFNESPSLGIELTFNRSQTVKLVAPIGDILTPVRFTSLEAFISERSKLTGMNELTSNIKLSKEVGLVKEKIDSIILSLANLCSNGHLRGGDEAEEGFHYSGATLKHKSLTLVTAEIVPGTTEGELKLKVTVNCEKMVLGSILSKLIKDEVLKQL